MGERYQSPGGGGWRASKQEIIHRRSGALVGYACFPLEEGMLDIEYDMPLDRSSLMLYPAATQSLSAICSVSVYACSAKDSVQSDSHFVNGFLLRSSSGVPDSSFAVCTKDWGLACASSFLASNNAIKVWNGRLL